MGLVTSFSLTRISLVPITFFGEPIQYAELNNAVLIKCRVLANPAAEVSWFKGRDKNRLVSSNYERSNDGLKIHRVSLADNDLFWCQADVLETGESKDYPIQVVIAREHDGTCRSKRTLICSRNNHSAENRLCIAVCSGETNSNADL